MRAFVAVDLDAALRKSLGRIQGQLREVAPRLRCVAPEAMHLTVKFLSEIDDGAAPEVSTAIAAVARSMPGFDFEVRGLGAFADRRGRVRVVYAGVEDVDARLGTLAERLDAGLAPLGFPPEDRPFHPHLTLARSRQPLHAPELGDFISDRRELQIGAQAVEAVTLYESLLEKSGPRYLAVSRHALA